jgi:Spy/CpxP family protein refolding chaperone
MRTNHKKLGLTVALLATVVFALFANPANAQGRSRWMRGMSRYAGWWANTNVPQQYQLSPEQMTRLRDIRAQYDDKITPLRTQLHALSIEARGYASRPDANIEEIKSYRKDINDLEDEIEDLRLEARAEINKVLTKEQRAYFGNDYDWWYTRRGMMHDMMGHMYEMCPMMSDRWGW